LPKSPEFHPSKPKPGLPGTPELPKSPELKTDSSAAQRSHAITDEPINGY
jgi:hypothetical protein